MTVSPEGAAFDPVYPGDPIRLAYSAPYNIFGEGTPWLVTQVIKKL